MHAGKQQIAAVGAPERGGRPPTSRLYVRHLQPEQTVVFDEARDLLGKLDQELCLARANLDQYVREHQLNFRGGTPVSVATGGGGVSIVPHVEIILRHLDKIRLLELARKQLHEALGDDARGALRDLMDRIRTGAGDNDSDDAGDG